MGIPACKASSPGPVRLIGSDGRVLVYRRRVHAAELMAEHPRHLICRSDSFYIGRKVPALSESDELQPGNSYFLLPTHFFHSVLSFVTVATSLTSASSGSKPVIRPFDIHKTAAGTLQIRVSDEFIEAAESDGEVKGKCGRVCTTEALEKDYRQLVRCRSRQWKPELETIREFGMRRSLWGRRGGGVLFGFRRKKKLNHVP